MAKEIKPKESRIKTKKKVWYRIISPQLFGNKELGESYLSSPESAVGRTLKLNLRDLTGNIKDQNIYVSFKIVKVDGTTLRTETTGYELTPTFVKRLVRKNTTRLDEYSVFETKNGKKVIVKPIIITNNRTQRSVRTELRKKFLELLREEISKSDFDALVSNLVSYKVQSVIKKKLSKIFPVREATVRVLAITENAKLVVKEFAESRSKKVMDLSQDEESEVSVDGVKQESSDYDEADESEDEAISKAEKSSHFVGI
ncbi:MAG TPA: hypothetical protein VJC39_03575 [Candidatus Nanoarchaeia archaeon]|nr:hypothetical protein [Candidatus Nanoarchaeia archaeon]